MHKLIQLTISANRDPYVYMSSNQNNEVIKFLAIQGNVAIHTPANIDVWQNQRIFLETGNAKKMLKVPVPTNSIIPNFFKHNADFDS